jgi:glycosyltransferase involved in cell wall biosynthesis
MEELNPKDKIKIFIWQPSIEHLQYFTWRALQSLVQLPITFIVGTLENKIRKEQNWKLMELQELNPIVLPSERLRREGLKLLNENPDAIHVFFGFRGGFGYNFFPLIFQALRGGIRVVIMDEPFSVSPVGYFHDENIIQSYVKSWIRPWLRYGMVKILYAASTVHKPCIIALSMIAKKQFLSFGLSSDAVFPFGYFVPRQELVLRTGTKSNTLRMIFVGALIFRKGLDILVNAIKILCGEGYRVELDVYGAGDSEQVKFVDLPIFYKSTLPFDQIQGVIADHDVLVLPSRHDGWGVVVNEALMQGVPVIVSSRVGAKQILEASAAGLVFESENVNDLVEKIKILIDNPAILDQMKRQAQSVGQELSPEKAAEYFLDVLKYYFYEIGTYPSAIWSEEFFQE